MRHNGGIIGKNSAILYPASGRRVGRSLHDYGKGNIKPLRNDIAFSFGLYGETFFRISALRRQLPHLREHILDEDPVARGGVVDHDISKLMIPTPQSPQHSAKYSGKSPYFGRFESELTCSVRSLSISNTKSR